MLDHPLLVKIYQTNIRDGKLGIITDFCNGKSLQDLIDERKKKNKPFSDQEVLKYLATLTLGLNEFHKNGIQHRDVRPRNILVTREKKKEYLKISNFGMAKSKHAPKKEGEDVHMEDVS